MSKSSLQSLSFVLSIFILGGFYVGLLAWTGPTSAPPGSNASSPINIGTSDQDKAGRLSATEFYDADNSSFYINPSGDSMVSGTLSLGGDLYDLTNGKKIYDSATGKFDPSVMPYEKGDLVSDWASNSYSSGYYEVSNITASGVDCGASFGRGQTGTRCGTCYSCSSGTCSPATVDGSAATTLGCTAGNEGCRRCNNGSCSYYNDAQQHNCPSDQFCNFSGQCKVLPNNYCTAHNGVATAANGDKVFCEGGKMWSTTLASGYKWSDAKTACSNLSHAGFSDWYLPDTNTLVALYGTDSNHLACSNSNCTSWDPKCCDAGANFPGRYWAAGDCCAANSVSFHSGSVDTSPTETYSLSERCIRQ